VRWYDINGKKLESVTTILGDTTPHIWMLPYVKKHALMALWDMVNSKLINRSEPPEPPWSYEPCPEYNDEDCKGLKCSVCASQKAKATIIPEITEKDIKYCLDAHKRHSEVAMAYGSLVHSAIEVDYKEKPENYDVLLYEYYPQIFDIVLSFSKCLLDNKIEVIESEQTVWYDAEIEYAGTLDLIAEMDGELWIGDIKTFTPKFKWKAFNGGKRALRVAETKEELEELVKGKECEIRKVYDNKVPDKKDHWIQTEAYRRAYNQIICSRCAEFGEYCDGADDHKGRTESMCENIIENRFILYLNKLDTSHYELVKMPKETNDEHWEVFKAQYITHKFYK